MKSIRLHAAGNLRLHEEPIPVPKENEALIKVTAVGVCGSDLHWFGEGNIGTDALQQPLVLGHEFAGVTTDGQRVAVDPSITCGHCEFCEEGNPNFCTSLRFAGHGTNDGALREYLPWPARFLFPLPDEISDADGAMLEPLGVAIHAVNLAHIRPGMSVGILGCGPIGLLTLQVARISGAASLVATDPLPYRLEAARSMGATQTYPADGNTENGQIQAATKGRGLDVVFEAAGTPEAVESAMLAAKPGGTVILAGIPSKDETRFSASVSRRKGLTIRIVRRMKNTYPTAIRLVQNGLVDVRSIVTHRFPLVRAAEAFALAARREGLKVVIDA
ncbi:MAG: zinc-dependent alcohol dehydrogenase [Chloroflexota bacterium]